MTYAPQPVIYTRRVVRPRGVVRVRYAAPRRIIHHSAYRPHAQRVIMHDGGRRSGRVIVR